MSGGTLNGFQPDETYGKKWVKRLPQSMQIRLPGNPATARTVELTSLNTGVLSFTTTLTVGKSPAAALQSPVDRMCSGQRRDLSVQMAQS
jgi:hypothetical protein